MSLVVPEWLNDEFIQNSLQNGEEDKQLVIKRFDISTVVPPGNNYGSCLLRVNVEYKKTSDGNIHQMNLIVKGPLTQGPIKDILDTAADVEPTFYKEFIPTLRRLSINTNFVPKTYFTARPNVVVLEDLKVKGYLMADRCEQLDFDHCQLYAIAAATFHAASVAVHKENPELVEKKLGKEKFFLIDLKSIELLKNIYIHGIIYVADLIENLDEFSKYSKILRKCASSIWEVLLEIHKPCKTLNALTQGDPWVTNMMFKYDESKKAADIKLIDFQALRYCSPVIDLVFFIWISAKHDVRENRLDELYHIYCDTLNEKLEEFACSERIPYERFLKTIRVLSPLALGLSLSYYPLMMAKTPVDWGLVMARKDISDTDFYKHFFSDYYTKEYSNLQLPRILKQFESAGIFDNLEINIEEL